MAFRYSNGFRNAVLDTGSVKGVFDGGFIRVYAAGQVPASADDELPGDAQVLVTYTVDGDGTTGLSLESSAVDGVIAKNSTEVWQGQAVASGVGVFFRYERSGDSGAYSDTDVRIQGTVGGGGADLFVSNNSFSTGSTYTLDFFSLTFIE